MFLLKQIMRLKLGSDRVILHLVFQSEQMRQPTLESWSVTRSSSHVFQFFEEHLVMLLFASPGGGFTVWHVLDALPSLPTPACSTAPRLPVLLQIPLPP
ncbi:unnamed protein product [Gulo gulo]|uniref:Uncharacterized protein n=1 Tax=Gulo gulo TaxID=48420 RepID=A0A9X9M077_GULGU|nr:unnamed protein product [Gulo gulo]